MVRAAFFGLCPVCGTQGLWATLARFSASCPLCGADFAGNEPSGRALYVLMLPITVLLALGAVQIDGIFNPPLLVDALVWPPLVAAVVIGALRLGKVAVLRTRLRRAAS